MKTESAPRPAPRPRSGMPVWMRYFSILSALALATVSFVFIGLSVYILPISGGRPAGLAALGIGIVAMVICALFLLAVYYRKTGRGRSIATNLMLAGVSTLMTLGLAELVVAIFAPAVTLKRAIMFSPGMYRQSTILPFQLKPGYQEEIRSKETRRKISMRINRHGFRGDDFTWEKPPETYRILLLGDSFAINVAVEDDQVHTAVLERLLNDRHGGSRRYEVINAGYANGYSPDSYIAFMLQQGFDLDPDLVMMQYFVRNDFKDLLETEVVETRDGMPFRVRSKYRHVDSTGRYRRNISFKYKIPVLRNSHLYATAYEALNLDGISLMLAPKLISGYSGDNFTPNDEGIKYLDVFREAGRRPPALQQAFDQSMDYVRMLDRRCTEAGASFVLFLVPTGKQITRDRWPEKLAESWDDPNPQKQIVEALRGSGIRILHPLWLFRESQGEEPLYLGKKRDGHWTAAGNELAARAMYDYLAAMQIFQNPGNEIRAAATR